MDTPVRDRKHRLPGHFYRGRVAVVFTACLTERRPLLANEPTFRATTEILRHCAEDAHCSIPVFTVMPDHLHILVIGQDASSDTKRLMDRFKHRSGWWLYRNLPEAKWQSSYWDHIVRDFEGWRSQARYIALNPCRAGLAEDIFAWPYTGSIDYDVKEVLSEAFWDV